MILQPVLVCAASACRCRGRSPVCKPCLRHWSISLLWRTIGRSFGRYQLSQFWLAAPVDQLQVLYGSSIGDLQRVLLGGPLVQQELAGDEQQWRDQLANKLNSSDQAAQRINVLLALMSYSPAGSLKLADPAVSVPDWLLEDYSTYCDPECVGDVPVGLLKPAGDSTFEPLTQRAVKTRWPGFAMKRLFSGCRS